MSTSFKVPAPFIGVGTGRCGSHTLVEFLDAQSHVRCVHEVTQVPWYEPGSSPQLGTLIRRLKQDGKKGCISGEVGPSLLPAIPHLRSAVKGLKIVCLHRPKHEVVRSFLEYGSSMPPLRPKEKYNWADGCLGPDRLDSHIPKCFPTIDGASRQQAIGFYWELYEQIMRNIKGSVFHMQMQQLNDADSRKNLLDFLEIPDCDRVEVEVKRSWSIEECNELKRKAKMEHLYA
jgi:hypothetical protein